MFIGCPFSKGGVAPKTVSDAFTLFSRQTNNFTAHAADGRSRYYSHLADKLISIIGPIIKNQKFGISTDIKLGKNGKIINLNELNSIQAFKVEIHQPITSTKSSGDSNLIIHRRFSVYDEELNIAIVAVVALNTSASLDLFKLTDTSEIVPFGGKEDAVDLFIKLTEKVRNRANVVTATVQDFFRKIVPITNPIVSLMLTYALPTLE